MLRYIYLSSVRYLQIYLRPVLQNYPPLKVFVSSEVLRACTFVEAHIYSRVSRSMRQMTDVSFESGQCSFPAGRQATSRPQQAIWQIHCPAFAGKSSDKKPELLGYP